MAKRRKPPESEVAAASAGPLDRYREPQEEWWSSYSGDLPTLGEPQRQLKEYLIGMLGRRLDLPWSPRSKPPAAEPPMAELERQFERVVSTVFGIDSVLLAMQDDVPVQQSGREGIADHPLPSPVNIRPVRLPATPRNVPVETIAFRVPQECFYVRCRRLANYTWLRQFVMHWGGSMREIVSTPELDYEIRQTIEQQLALSPETSRERSIDDALSDMALIGCDLLFRDGPAVGVLFEAKDGDRLDSILQQQRATVKQRDARVEQTTITIENHPVSLLSTAENTVRSFYVVDGSYHLVTNSRYIAGRFLQTGDRLGGLGGLDEFRYARRKDPSSRETPIWIYLSDPFFRKLTSPQYRIEMGRRARALAELQQLRLASLVAAKEGFNADSIRSLIDEQYLPADFAQRPDESQPHLVGHTAIDSLRGRPGTFLPVPDVMINKATRAEVVAYGEFASGYRRQWRATDPVIVSISSSAAEQLDREKVSLGVFVTPYARERYEALARHLAPASGTRIARVRGDALCMEAGLHEGGRTYQVHVGLQDSAVPYVVREGQMVREGDFASSTYFRRNAYVVVNPSGTQGLRLLDRFARNLEDGDFAVASVNGARPQTIGPPEHPLAYALGRMLAAAISNALESVFVGSLIEQQGPWTILGREAEIRESVRPRLALEQVTSPAQMRIRMVNVNRTAAAPYINAFAYLESRKVSAANAQLLDLLNQQLNVPPRFAQIEAERVFRARLVCPLGGEYRLATDSNSPYWSSSAWTTRSYYDLSEVPADYRFPFLDWLRGLDVAFNLTPNTLSAKVELQVKQERVELADLREPDFAEDDVMASAKDGATASAEDRAAHTDVVDQHVRRVQDSAEVRPGDMVVILDDQAKLMIGETLIGVLTKHERLRVVQIERDWMGIFDERNGKLIRGWVHVSHVGMR